MAVTPTNLTQEMNNPVITTATACYFMEDDFTAHRAYQGSRRYTANSNAALLRLYSLPCSQKIAIDRGPDEQIQFRAGATIEVRRAPGWEWERYGAYRLLFVFGEADVIARPRATDKYTGDACFADNPQMWS